ncbi:LPS export ABC transporter permease LptF [Plesiomonas sp.]|uniref:LPS export ABC transporter permease LptF n=1 Tax=Plesiomonas sp. TaxID=2486279 RepID=UPI003F3A6E72
MIIIRYLVREVLKSQIAILFVLMLIFFCQKLVRVLSSAVEGDLPADLVLSILGLGLPYMAQLMLPLSLFVGLLFTYGRLYAESEMTVMFACGMGKRMLVRAAVWLALFTSIMAAVNVLWLSPLSAQTEERVISEAKANPGLAALVAGQFQSSPDGSSVIFVNNIDNNKLNNVFVAQLRPRGESSRPSIVVSKSGEVEKAKNGDQMLILDNGVRYEGTAFLRDFRITHFDTYNAVIGHQDVAVDNSDWEQMSTRELWNNGTIKARSELNWRLTLIVAVPILALLVIPLSAVNPRQGRFANVVPALLLYLIYFLLQSSLKSALDNGRIDTSAWMWLTNAGFLALGLILNIWDSVPMRRFRAKWQGESV